MSYSRRCDFCCFCCFFRHSLLTVMIFQTLLIYLTAPICHIKQRLQFIVFVHKIRYADVYIDRDGEWESESEITTVQTQINVNFCAFCLCKFDTTWKTSLPTYRTLTRITRTKKRVCFYSKSQIFTFRLGVCMKEYHDISIPLPAVVDVSINDWSILLCAKYYASQTA